MDILTTIEKDAAKTRRLAIFLCVLAIVFAAFIGYICMTTVATQKKTIYALDAQNNVVIYNQVRENRKVEAEGHYRDFHELFFNLSPDGKLIETNITKHALELIDNTGKVYFDQLMKSNFYSNLIVLNLSQQLEIDSILVSDQHPYEVKLWGKLYLINDMSIKMKSLITTGRLRNTYHRTSKNPHAFIIEQFRILENNDLKEYKRR